MYVCTKNRVCNGLQLQKKDTSEQGFLSKIPFDGLIDGKSNGLRTGCTKNYIFKWTKNRDCKKEFGLGAQFVKKGYFVLHRLGRETNKLNIYRTRGQEQGFLKRSQLMSS